MGLGPGILDQGFGDDNEKIEGENEAQADANPDRGFLALGFGCQRGAQEDEDKAGDRHNEPFIELHQERHVLFDEVIGIHFRVVSAEVGAGIHELKHRHVAFFLHLVLGVIPGQAGQVDQLGETAGGSGAGAILVKRIDAHIVQINQNTFFVFRGSDGP